MAAQISNTFEIGARLQRRDIDPNKGVYFIICDGYVHFLNIRILGTDESATMAMILPL